MNVLNALLRQSRLQLTDVYDPCLAKAQENAQHLDATFSPSLDGMLRRCQGVVIGDVKWMGLEPVSRACELQRPSLILQSVLAQLSQSDLERLQKMSFDSRTMIMPELSFRWARSTLRLRELTATQAGAIERLELTYRGEPGSHAELMAFDWCCNVMQSECRSVIADTEEDTVLLKFRRPDRHGNSVTARIQSNPAAGENGCPTLTAKIECRHGRVDLTGEEKLDWEIDRRRVSDSLASDRSASDVMFDLFGRRLVGGIVPIPEISDLMKSHEIRRGTQKSRETAAEVRLDDPAFHHD
ncbi:hypothetical protein SH661x_003271 [Planctomicrobium sp. SH661]|uniref:hypothetical protein n=1 Tax=Planctomicrobium sp. SH661 TaxID=3448124 RepID=UPI003F5C8A27